MYATNLFTKSLLTSPVKLHPSFLVKDYKDHVLDKLKDMFEGKCTKFGYIQPNTIDLVRMSEGRVELQTYKGYAVFDRVEFYANVCNPAIGSVIPAKVKNMNNFAHWCIGGYTDENGIIVPIIEISVPKRNGFVSDDSLLKSVKKDSIVHIEILGKKFMLNDTKIGAFGKIVDKGIDIQVDDKEYTFAEDDDGLEILQFDGISEEDFEDDFDEEIIEEETEEQDDVEEPEDPDDADADDAEDADDADDADDAEDTEAEDDIETEDDASVKSGKKK